eukprot:4134920-Pyramimonas_sp.AAC.2
MMLVTYSHSPWDIPKSHTGTQGLVTGSLLLVNWCQSGRLSPAALSYSLEFSHIRLDYVPRLGEGQGDVVTARIRPDLPGK